MNIAVSYRNISKSYGNKMVLSDISLDIAAGEFVTIIGASGDGKTTLLKMVNGLVVPDGGDLFVGGENIRDIDIIRLRRSIGYAIQGSVLFPHMTVEENISYVPRLWNKGDHERTRRAVKKWMEIVRLPESLRDHYPDELSGGQQQRVGIARALAASPTILLMDEPFGAVDEITRAELQDEIRRIHRETSITILFVTHDIREALLLGTRVLVIEAGRIGQYAAPDELRRAPATEFAARLVGR